MQYEELFSAIRSKQSSRELVIRKIYADTGLQNGIKKILLYGKASEEEFNEIFNYTLVQFLKRVMENKDFKIEKNLNSYLFGIAKNLWLHKLKERKHEHLSLLEDYELYDDATPIDLLIIHEEKKDILHNLLTKLGVKCKEVLLYWAEGYRMREIAKVLDYSSEGVVRRKKFTCLKELSAYLSLNPKIKEILKQ